jgi:molybdopterin-guanine dinucleotide biosynthesis protein A
VKLLGAVLAGGAARRFGSDKALGLYQGRPLIEHVLAALALEADAVIVTGREWVGGTGIADSPGPGLGPLGGLCAALHHAAARGFDAVLSAGCDLPTLPAGLSARFAPGPAHALGQPTVGLWPATLAPALAAHIDAGGRSLHGWATACRARAVDIGTLANINTPADLTGLCSEA